MPPSVVTVDLMGTCLLLSAYKEMVTPLGPESVPKLITYNMK